MPSRTDDTLHVHIPGVILALLQHEMLNAVLQNNVEGILFGTRETRLKAQTTDHSSDETHSATTVLISSYVCMDPSRRYYNQRGEIIPERLAELTRGKEDSVVGMFKWRRNSKLALAIREEAVYKSLQYHQSASGQENAQVIGIFTASNDDPALFQFDFAFYNQQGESSPCGKVPTVVANLVESAQIQHEWFVPATPSFAHLSDARLTSRLQQLSQRYIQDHNDCLDDSLSILKDASLKLLESEAELQRLRAARGIGSPITRDAEPVIESPGPEMSIENEPLIDLS